MNNKKHTFPAVFEYVDPNPTDYAALTSEQIAADIQLLASIPSAGYFYHRQLLLVTGQKVTDPYDRYDTWQYRGEYWLMEPLCGPDTPKYSQTFPTSFRLVSLAELSRYLEENRRRIHQKVIHKIQRLIADGDQD